MPHDQDPTEARVARGASHLDAHLPGWERRIDLAILDLADSCRCVLGQLYAQVPRDHIANIHWTCTPYSHGAVCVPDAIGEDVDNFAYDHGFEAWGPDTRGEYALLDEAWITLIKARYDTGALSDSETCSDA